MRACFIHAEFFFQTGPTCFSQSSTSSSVCARHGQGLAQREPAFAQALYRSFPWELTSEPFQGSRYRIRVALSDRERTDGPSFHKIAGLDRLISAHQQPQAVGEARNIFARVGSIIPPSLCNLRVHLATTSARRIEILPASRLKGL